MIESGEQGAWFAVYDAETGAIVEGSAYGDDASSRMEIAAVGRRFAITNRFEGLTDLDPSVAGSDEREPAIDDAMFVFAGAFPGSVATDDGPASRPRLEVWPNPSSGAVTIRLTEDVRQGVAVFDVLGRRVAVLEDVAGETALPSLAPGVYIVRVGAASATLTVVR